jgi:hypothetical protein
VENREEEKKRGVCGWHFYHRFLLLFSQGIKKKEGWGESEEKRACTGSAKSKTAYPVARRLRAQVMWGRVSNGHTEKKKERLFVSCLTLHEYVQSWICDLSQLRKKGRFFFFSWTS